MKKIKVHGVVYAFEPGIARREGSASRFIEEVAPTLRANSGDNRTAVAYRMTEKLKPKTLLIRCGCAGGARVH